MTWPKISVVTISYNQRSFLARAINSVLNQDYDNIEYIVVDPGSTDGSRELIAAYSERIARTVFEPDRGAADGLNHGFSLATGEIYCYLNSDDEFEPGAFSFVSEQFRRRPDVDVFCGHAYVVDESGNLLRRVWSDPVDRKAIAYGTSIQIQPSTFMRRQAFVRTDGFNIENRSNWDGELMISLMATGAKIEVIDRFLSKYRIHNASITGTGSHDAKIQSWSRRRFQLLMGRDWEKTDEIARIAWLVQRQLRNPKAFLERALKGPVYKRAV